MQNSDMHGRTGAAYIDLLARLSLVPHDFYRFRIEDWRLILLSIKRQRHPLYFGFAVISAATGIAGWLTRVFGASTRSPTLTS